MSDYSRRYAAACAEMEAKGIGSSTAMPPATRLMHRLGLEPKPPLYQHPLLIAVKQGLFFGVFWGLFMWFLIWGPQGIPGQAVIALAALAGLLFGGAMAAYMGWLRQRKGLTHWEDL